MPSNSPGKVTNWVTLWWVAPLIWGACESNIIYIYAVIAQKTIILAYTYKLNNTTIQGYMSLNIISQYLWTGWVSKPWAYRIPMTMTEQYHEIYIYIYSPGNTQIKSHWIPTSKRYIQTVSFNLKKYKMYTGPNCFSNTKSIVYVCYCTYILYEFGIQSGRRKDFFGWTLQCRL